MIGLFINTIPVRIKLEKDSRFLQLLKQVQHRAIASKPFEYFPLAEVQSVSPLKGDIIDHLLVYESRPVMTREEEKSRGHEGKKSQGNPGTAGFALVDVEPFHQVNYDFGVVVYPNPMQLVLYYNPLVYEIDFIKNIVLHVKELIIQVVENPARDVRYLEIVSQEERDRILFDLNNTEAAYPREKTIHELFEIQVEKTPDNIAAAGEGEIGFRPRLPFVQVTYRELNKKANQLAHLLKRQGVTPKAILGLMIDHSLEMLVGIWGVLKAGCAFLPIDPGYPQKRVISMLKDCCAPMLLVNTGVLIRHHLSFTALQGSRLQLPGDEIRITPPRPQIKDFDSIGIPDRS